MVFSSVPVYLDPPNWQQETIYQPNHHQPSGGGGSNENNQKLLPPPPPPSTGVGSVRPPGMADRARLAKLPQPDQLVPQKCPRCDSTNTKFCYFNNYSLTQPRHFCKTCRRYWTRGGALRNVPVGGGCRRNKRSKGSTSSSRSKSPATTAAGSSSTSSAADTVIHANACTSDMLGHLVPPSQQPYLPFFPPLHNLSNFGAGDHNIGLNFGGGGNGAEMGFLGSSSNGGGGDGGPNFSTGLGEQWRIMPQVQQFHFLAAGLEQPPSGLYQYDQVEGVDQPPSYIGGAGQLRAKQPLDFGVNTNLASVKSEGNQGLNLSRNFLGTVQGNDQYWGSSANNNAWTDLSAFNSSSTSHLL